MATQPGRLDSHALAEDLRRVLRGDVYVDHPLGPMTTYRVGGRAAIFVSLADADDAATLAGALHGQQLPVLTIGRGSNMLVSDRGFPGIAVHLADAFTDVQVSDDHQLTAGGAALLPVVARVSVRASLTGFEWAVGVPGSIGGAVRMNAGGHGSDMAAAVVDARIVDFATGERRTVTAAALDFGYRRSSVTTSQCVLSARLQLAPGDPAVGDAALSEIVRWRREHQPGGQNAGSVFTNPAGDSAGRLIDTAGAKGRRIGTAEVSEKHANFFQADPAGRADDLYALMVTIRDVVLARHGVRLHPETRLVGFTADELDELFGPDRGAAAGDPHGLADDIAACAPESTPGDNA